MADIVMISLGKEVRVWEECGGEESVRGVQCVIGDRKGNHSILLLKSLK